MLPSSPVTKLPEYWVWHSMRQRCENPNHKHYYNYGGRGISVCGRWRFGTGSQTGFQCFYQDLGPRLTPLHTLERLRVNEGYAPDNCAWKTRSAQSRNRRDAFKVEFRGKQTSVNDLADAASQNLMTVRYRILVKGMAPEDALSAAPGTVLPLPKSGIRGVYHHPRRPKPWQARMKVDGKFKSFGYYATEQEAGLALERHKDRILLDDQ